MIAHTHGGDGFIDATGTALSDSTGAVEDIIPIHGTPTILDDAF